MKQPSATAVPGTAGLKLRINLRDRQMIRKRHRSSSPSNSSDSSSTNGSNRPTRSHTVSAGGSKSSLQVKRNRREHVHDANTDDITPPEEESPPLSDGKRSTYIGNFSKDATKFFLPVFELQSLRHRAKRAPNKITDWK